MGFPDKMWKFLVNEDTFSSRKSDNCQTWGTTAIGDMRGETTGNTHRKRQSSTAGT